MRKTVIVYEVYETRIEVEANSDQDALDIAECYLNKGVNENTGFVIPDGEFSYVLDKSEWDVFDS